MHLERSRIGIILQKKNQKKKIRKDADAEPDAAPPVDTEPIYGMSSRKEGYKQHWEPPNYPPCNN